MDVRSLGLLDAGFGRFLLTLSFGVFQLTFQCLFQDFFLRANFDYSPRRTFLSIDRLSSLIKTAAAKTVVHRPSLLPTAD